MEKIIETYKKEVFDNFGKRVSGGKCSFCGKELNNGEYCECSEATLVNRYFKRAWKKIQKLQTNLYLLLLFIIKCDTIELL